MLLADPRFEDAQSAYLEANKRAMSGDFAGAVGTAVEAVKAVLKAVGCEGGSLERLAEEAAAKGVPGAVPAILIQLRNLQAPGDGAAARLGAEEAMLTIHLAASLIKYLQRRLG